MKVGTVIDYRIMLRVIPLRWRSEITVWNPPYSFQDIQLKGPYSKWEHLHTFTETVNGTLVEDRIEYKVFGGALIEKFFVRPDLMKIFSFRMKKLEEIFPA